MKHSNMNKGTLSKTTIDAEIERIQNLPSKLSKEEILNNGDRGFGAVVDMIEDYYTQNTQR